MNGWKIKFANQQAMTPERRKAVVVAAGVAILGGPTSILAHGHPYLVIGVIALMLAGLVYAGSLLARSKCSDN